MSTYDSTKIEMDTYDETLAKLIIESKSKFGDSIDTSADEYLGHELINIARIDSDTKQALQHVIDSLDINAASGSILEVLVALIGLYRQEATYSTVTLTITATDLTTVPAGTQYSTANDVVFATNTDLVFASAGDQTVAATCIVVGDHDAGIDEVTTIVNPVFGISAVTNAAAATPGRYQETDPQLRARHTVAVATSGDQDASSIYEAVTAVSGVSSVYIFENDTDTAIGVVPANTIYVVAIGGTDANIAAAISNNKVATIKTYGATTVSVYNETTSQAKDISFGRATPVPIYIKIDIDTIPGVFPDDGEEQIRDLLVADYAAKKIADNVIYASHYKSIFGVPGISAINSLLVDTADPPVDSVDITMSQTQLATLASGDIDFV